MKPEDVFKSLSVWRRSSYYGIPPQEIANVLNYNRAIRYLNDLVLLRNLDISDLNVIFEQNSSIEESVFMSSGDGSLA